MSLQSSAWRRVLGKAFRLTNVCLYAVCHRKIDLVDQKRFWEMRSLQGVDDHSAAEADPYYQNFDRTVGSYLERYKGLSQSPYVEIGTYQGYRLEKFASRIRERLFIGVDLGFANLRIGKQNCLHSPNVRIVNADACHLPFPSNLADLIYTVVALSHVPFGKIRNALSEIFRVSRRYVLLVEIDCRPMRWRKKLEAISLPYGYMHRYEKLVDQTIARLVQTETLRDDKGHPRYTVFLFAKY